MTLQAVWNADACYDCGARSGLEPWSPPWDRGAAHRYARCGDRDRCAARARSTRERATRRQGLIVLELAPSPSDKSGECRWCGQELRRRQDGSPSRRSRCEPRYEGRDCARAHRRSRTYDVREAIRWRDRREHGCVRCADCGVICEPAEDTEPGVPWEGDHELALEDGGEHTLENLRARCVPCHARKTSHENRARAAARRLQRVAATGQLTLAGLSEEGGGTPLAQPLVVAE